ncbi:MAG TPA: hypothetical protein VFZ09_14420 [Archangium sp.]|uniref:hypothetical protein n=1 Tax=Archangium sp. TaxID=1872627 RepID=UPI002E380A30|nr:hypothetical protein [Archangium sp.]HEX5747436.1 hypothetical protein [Archangium sp.]
MSISSVGRSGTAVPTRPTESPTPKVVTPEPQAKPHEVGFSGESRFEVADARAGGAEKKTPLEQAAELSSTVNTWGGAAGSLLYGLDKKLNIGAKLQNTQQGVNTALNNRAHLAVGRELVERGYDKTIQQTKNLLNNPAVKKDPQLMGRLQKQLQIATQSKAKALKPFDTSLRRMDDFLAANKSKLANLSKQSKALGVIGDSLTAAGAATNGFSVAANSPAQTQAGKIVDGVLAGVTNYLFGKGPGLAGIGAVDAVTGQHISNALNGVVGTAVTLAEAGITGDTKGLEELARKSQSGDYGIFLQAGNAAGNAITTLGDPNSRERFVEDAASGKYGVVGQFGNALGEGLGRIFFGGD